MAVWFPKIRVLAGKFKLGGTLFDVPYVTQDPWPSTTNDNPLLPLQSEAWNIPDEWDWSQQDDAANDFDELTYVAGVFDSAPVGPNQPPQSPEDAWDWSAEEPEIYIVSSGYQQSNGIPQPVEDAWVYVEELADDEWIIDHNDDFDAINLDNNPLLTVEDVFDWSAEEPEIYIVASGYQQSDAFLTSIPEDTWVYVEELADDEWIIDHNDDFDAINLDNNPLLAVQDEWLYVEELADDEWIIDHNDDFDAVAPDNNHLLTVEDVFDWSAEEPEVYVVSSGYQQFDGLPQPVEDSWDHWLTDDADDYLVIDDYQFINLVPPSLVEDAFDWSAEEPEIYIVSSGYQQSDVITLVLYSDTTAELADQETDDDTAWILVGVSDVLAPSVALGVHTIEDAWIYDEGDNYEPLHIPAGYQQADNIPAPSQPVDDLPDMQEEDFDEFFTNHFSNDDADPPVDDGWDWGQQDTDDEDNWQYLIGEELVVAVPPGIPISHGEEAEIADIELDDDEWILRDTDVLGASVAPTSAQYYEDDFLLFEDGAAYEQIAVPVGYQTSDNLLVTQLRPFDEIPDMQEDDFDEFFTNHFSTDDADLPVDDAWDWGEQDTDDEDTWLYGQSDTHVLDLPPTGLQFYGEDAENADVDFDDDEWAFRDTDVLPPTIALGPEQFFGLDAEQADLDIDDDIWFSFATDIVGANEIPNPVEDAWDHFLTDDADDYLVTDDYASIDNDPVLSLEDSFDHFLTDDADDYLVIDDYQLIDNNSLLSLEDAFDHFITDDADDYLVIDDYQPVDNNLSLTVEDVYDWYLEEPEDYLVIDDYPSIDSNVLLSTEDAFDWSAEEPDEDDRIMVADPVGSNNNPLLTVEDTFDWFLEEPDEDDRTMVADAVGADTPPNPAEDPWDWTQDTDDELFEVLDTDAVSANQPNPPVEDAYDWAYEEPENDIDWALDALATAATIPSQVLEDAFDWDVDQDEADAYFETLENYFPDLATIVFPAPSVIVITQYSSVMAIIQYSSVIIIQQ